MEIAFQAIGIEVPNEIALNELAVDVSRRGEAFLLRRNDGVLHGRCLRFGKGLEVWTMLYESRPGVVVYADCRPAFRARNTRRVTPWILTELAEEGAAVVQGYLENTGIEVVFELQNLTEAGTRALQETVLEVGLCGLAYRAEVFGEAGEAEWKSYDEIALNVIQKENDWSVSGRILALESIRNVHSGSDLFWFFVEAGDLKLEILVNQQALKGVEIGVGSWITADIWLQGHVAVERGVFRGYEGVDRTFRASDHWNALKRPN